MIQRACVLVATALAGLLFSPVFGFTTVLLPVGVVVVVLFAAALACDRWPVLTVWRPVLTLVTGLLAVIVTLAGGVTGEALRLLADGAVHGWQLTLQSTWPVRPDPRLVVFVPLAVLLAGVFGIELLHRVRSRLLALTPSMAVAGLSQVFHASTAVTATFAAIGFAVLAGMLLVDTRSVRTVAFAVPAVVLGVAGAVLVGGADPLNRPSYSLKQDEVAPVAAESVTSPLVGIAHRLHDPDVPVFRYTSASRPDRWPLVVLDRFDGVNWTPDGTYRRMGAELMPGPGVTVATRQHSATVDVGPETSPWLPSQTWPGGITGADPLVDEARGTLLASGPASASRYTISWWEADPSGLAGATIDPRAPGGFGGLGEVPPEVQELAGRAAGGLRPSFQAALVLERYLRDNYQVATGTDLPTGHSWPHLRRFLLQDQRGTSEQFAAAYVVLARTLGIPARLVAGFRAPERPSADGNFIVRNGHVLAWPEVAVTGVGWVALDPTGGAASSGSAEAGLAGVTAEARAQLPPAGNLRNPELPADERDAAASVDDPWNWLGALQVAGAVLGLLLAGWILGVPVVTAGRAWRRRRGAGAKAVLGAWMEARDRLRAHGVPVTAGMTVRDLAASARPVAGGSTVDCLGALAVAVDAALWSGAGTSAVLADQAWAAVRTVRKGLARRPFPARLRAAVDARVLFAPRR